MELVRTGKLIKGLGEIARRKYKGEKGTAKELQFLSVTPKALL